MSEQCEKCGSLFSKHKKETQKANTFAFIDKVEVAGSWKKRVISRFLIVSFFLLVAAWLFKPYYAVEWAPHYDATAETTLRYAMIAQEAYFVDHQTYADTNEKLSDRNYGFSPEKHVSFRVITADEEQYKMEAFHEKGKKKFISMGQGINLRL